MVRCRDKLNKRENRFLHSLNVKDGCIKLLNE